MSDKTKKGAMDDCFYWRQNLTDLVFSGFAKRTIISERYGYQKGHQSWLTYYCHKNKKILLSAAILARFCPANR